MHSKHSRPQCEHTCTYHAPACTPGLPRLHHRLLPLAMKIIRAVCICDLIVLGPSHRRRHGTPVAGYPATLLANPNVRPCEIKSLPRCSLTAFPGKLTGPLTSATRRNTPGLTPQPRQHGQYTLMLAKAGLNLSKCERLDSSCLCTNWEIYSRLRSRLRAG